MRKVIKECCGIKLLINNNGNLEGHSKSVIYDESDDTYRVKCPICGKKYIINKTDLKGFIPEDN